jgi:methylenetetrahydrofolate dehydrogenase (NADP+) / methenyltetrahydrofolate cyclohydrolase
MPKKELNGSDVASFIMERQRAVVRGMDRPPMLLIVSTNPTPVTDVYLGIKQRYADNIGAMVEVQQCSSEQALKVIHEANDNPEIDGIIVQLPLASPELTDDVLNAVSPEKDVDGLSSKSNFDPATPTAILWLLSAYNISIETKKVLVIGQGRLVGAPLSEMLLSSGVMVTVADEATQNLRSLIADAEIIVSAAGVPRLLTADMIPLDVVLVDAGTATDNGDVVGDVADDVRARPDVVITPLRGGVGPLTVAALFENLLRAVKR